MLIYKNSRFEISEKGNLSSIVIEDNTPNSVMVLAVLDGKIVTVKQCRNSIYQTVELPGGKIEQGESPEEASKRELLEETGLACGKLIHLGVFYTLPSLINRIIHVYFTNEITGVFQQCIDDDEKIHVETYSLEIIEENLKTNKWNECHLGYIIYLAKLKKLI